MLPWLCSTSRNCQFIHFLRVVLITISVKLVLPRGNRFILLADVHVLSVCRQHSLSCSCMSEGEFVQA